MKALEASRCRRYETFVKSFSCAKHRSSYIRTSVAAVLLLHHYRGIWLQSTYLNPKGVNVILQSSNFIKAAQYSCMYSYSRAKLGAEGT